MNYVSNITMQPTKTTQVDLGIKGEIGDYDTPYASVRDVFANVMIAYPTLFPVTYDDYKTPFIKSGGGVRNPYAMIHRMGTNKTSTNRGMKIFRSAGESDLWTGEAKVSKTYAANQDESSISYLYTGDDASSAAGIQIYDSTGGIAMAVYLTKIEIKTNTAIPVDTFPATSVTVKDSAGNVIANNGALTITKNDSNYQLTATKEPAWSTDNITWTSSNAAVTVTDGKLTFGMPLPIPM